MFTISQLNSFNSEISALEFEPVHLLKEIQKPVKTLLDSTPVTKLTITVEQPENFCEKGFKLPESSLYEKRNDFCTDPFICEYKNPYKGEVQIAFYSRKSEKFTDEEKEDLKFLASLIYSVFRYSYMSKLIHRSQDIDSSTGVLNVTGFKNLGKRVHGKRLMPKFAVIYMNIINFGSINDKFGHEVGDAMIRAYAQKVATFLEKDGSIAHLGGDNFAILVKKSILAKLLKFLQEVRVSVEVNGKQCTTEISVRAGITEGNRSLPVFDAYLGCAQAAFKSALDENLDDFVFF